MRILVVNWTGRSVGGTEDYLSRIMPELIHRGHEIAFVCEVDVPNTRTSIPLPEGTSVWDMSVLGKSRTLENMRAWRPDLIFAHGLLEPAFEAHFLRLAPSIYFTHNYYGACISGLKTFKFPTVRPCNRRFGAACLLHYLPRRCGGRSPITMLKLYWRESRRLANLKRYGAIVTHSRHMRQEYIRNGIPESRIHNFLYEIAAASKWQTPFVLPVLRNDSEPAAGQSWRLLFVGRMELLKGVGTLLDSLPRVIRELGRPIRLLLAGDGPERKALEKKCAKLRAEHPGLQVEFTGWLDRAGLNALYEETDLLVVPSLWPEPFGRIGPEAGVHGVPVAAFAVGGITDWLINGVNGYLAPGDPPTDAGLADAILKCLHDPGEYRELRRGAVVVASQFNLENHLESLLRVFNQVSGPGVCR